MRNFFVIFLVFFSFSLSAQQIDNLQHQIEESEAEIARISSELASNRDKQIESSTQIRLLEKRLKLRQNLVKQTTSKIASLDRTLRSYDSRVIDCEHNINSIKDVYRDLVLGISINSFSNSTFNEYQAQYLFFLTSLFSSKIDSLDSVISKTGVARVNISSQKKEMSNLLVKRKQEVSQIIQESKQLDSIKKSLKLGESLLLSQIESQRSRINQLQREIERLISLENSSVNNDIDETLTQTIKNAVGNLPSPLSVKGKIVDEYGVHNHPTIKGVKLSNKGINISFVGPSDVRSVADGIVKGIYKIAGMANTVLIRHGQFISVYSNLTDVSVNKGDNVSQNQKIGRIYGSETNENFIHFEFWKESQNLNPVQWVRF